MNEKLINKAIEARNKAYAPYSNFKVGTCLLTKEGNIYTGANIENAAYSPTNCGERTAFFTAIHNGERNFSKIAIVGGVDQLVYCYPCGVCRQIMVEFCKPDFQIIIGTGAKDFTVYTLKELLPYSFSGESLS